jgi:LemA protein
MRTLNARRLLLCVVAAMSLASCSYRKLTEQDEMVKAEWTRLQSEIRKRNAVIRRLVDVVKPHAARELPALQATLDSSTRLEQARTTAETLDAANQQSTAVAALLAVAEQDAAIKSNHMFVRLRDELAEIENSVAVGRMRYNGFVQQYNIIRRRFPGARLFNFGSHPFFEVPVSGPITTPRAPYP